MNNLKKKNLLVLFIIAIFIVVLITINNTNLVQKFSDNKYQRATVANLFNENQDILTNEESQESTVPLPEETESPNEENLTQQDQLINEPEQNINEETESVSSTIYTDEGSSSYTESGYYCKKTVTSEKLFVLLGEKINSTSPYTKTPLSDIWSTIDGENWKQEFKTTKMGAKWMPALVKTNEYVYIFGGVYDSSNNFDTSIFRTKDMVDFEYVGELPSTKTGDIRRTVVVYFKGKFWLLNGSGVEGVWSSYDGANWNQEVKDAPWGGNPNYIYLHSAIALKDMILFSSSHSGTPWVPMNYVSKDGINWTEYNTYKYFYVEGWPALYNPFIHNNKIWTVPRHDTDDASRQITEKYFYNIFNISLKDLIDPSNDGWTTMSTTSLFAKEKHHSEELGEVLISFKNKMWTIGGAKRGSISSGERWIKNDDKPGTLGTIMWSNNGSVWRIANQKGITYPGPADRTNAVATTLPWTYSSENAPDLEIETLKGINYIASGTTKDVNIGEWKLSAKSDDDKTSFTGKIKIKDIEIAGTFVNPKTSSLEYMKNIRMYVNGNLVATIPSFKEPFYINPCDPIRDCGSIVNKKIDFLGGKIGLTMSQGTSVNLKIVADLVNAPKEFTTSIYKFNYNKEASGIPCRTYNKNSKESNSIFPGKTIKVNPNIFPTLPRTNLPS